MSGVRVSEVTTHAPEGGRLLGGAIDRPTAGRVSERHALELAGWALGSEAPVTRVDVVSQDQLLQSIPVRQERPDIAALHPRCQWAAGSGYVGVLGTLALEPRFELELRATFADGATARLGTVAGHCDPVETGYVPRLAPLMLTSLGRSGSTALMHLLSSTDGVVCDARYPYELRIAKYWLHLLTVATAGADYEHSATHDSFHDSTFWVGRNPFHDTKDGPLREWLDTSHVGSFAGFVQEQIDAAYSAVCGAAAAPDGLRYFAEKTPPDRYPGLIRRLYGGARELFLVRDFRDVYCSISAFNDKRGYVAFGREQACSEVDYLQRLGGAASRMLDAWQARGDGGLLVRYEDLVVDPEGVMSSICDYLGLADVAAGAVAAVQRASATDERLREHRTTASSADSVGRWRRDLPAELRAECARSLDQALVGFGYEPTL